MTGVEVVTAPAVTTNDPVVAPCGIVTLDDAPATVLLELESATTTPPLPAGCVSVTVPAPFLPLIIVVGVMETPPSATAGGVTVTVDIALKPEYDRLNTLGDNALPFALHEWHVAWWNHLAKT